MRTDPEVLLAHIHMKNCAPRCARLMVCAGVFLATAAAGQAPKPADLTELPLEELLKLRVTSASKKEQTLSRVGAALYVLTREDIASSGAYTIPDLLRLVPGVEVAQINSNQWAISIRGFNTFYSNKVLAMIDGRALYQPSFSGVLWDQQDLPLEDIERIEVIRGPGGTIWGANAVNGVINIITRHSRDTQGGLITAGGGSWRTGEGLIQYGGRIGSAGTYRAFGKYFDLNSSEFPDGQKANDAWHSWAGGFRSDWDLTARDALTVQGDLRETVAGGTGTGTFSSPQPFQTVVNSPIRNTLGDLTGTWRHTLQDGSDTILRVYYDHMNREGEAGVGVSNNTLDADFEHHRALGARNDVVWGLGVRTYHDHFRQLQPYGFQLVPPRSAVALYSGFFQDEIQITNSLFLTVGSKLEHNDYTGVEYEPGAQLVWTPSDRHTLWASASRAIRQPDRIDFGIRLDQGTTEIGGLPALIKLSGSSAVTTERLHAYEAGYRSQIHPRLALDVTGFLNYYHNLETSEPGTPYFTRNPGGPGYLVLPLTFQSLGYARTYGTEAFLRWNPIHRWTLSPGYSYLHMAVGERGQGVQFGLNVIPGYSPKHHFQASSTVVLRRNLEWSADARYVSRRASSNISAYTGVDTMLRWHPRESLEVTISGRNLLSPGHLEYGDLANILLPTEVKRSGFVKLAWRF